LGEREGIREKHDLTCQREVSEKEVRKSGKERPLLAGRIEPRRPTMRYEEPSGEQVNEEMGEETEPEAGRAAQRKKYSGARVKPQREDRPAGKAKRCGELQRKRRVRSGKGGKPLSRKCLHVDFDDSEDAFTFSKR